MNIRYFYELLLYGVMMHNYNMVGYSRHPRVLVTGYIVVDCSGSGRQVAPKLY